jgi:hypothetical protein
MRASAYTALHCVNLVVAVLNSAQETWLGMRTDDQGAAAQGHARREKFKPKY